MNPAPTSFYQNTITSGLQAVYLGPFATAPTLDNFGNPLVAGQLYFNTTSNTLWVFSGTAWIAIISLTNPPTALVGLAAVSGATGKAMDAGSAPALDQSISPTWAGAHTFNNPVTHAVSLVADNTAGFQTVNAASATLTSGLVTVTIAAGTTLTLPASPAKGQHLWIRGGVTLTGAVISAASNVVPLNSTTAGTAIIAISGKFAHLVYDGTNWQIVEGA